jgi:predicted RNase H-like nuclease (RuvC/YqgF family)
MAVPASTYRSLIALLSVVAGMLLCAILVIASSGVRANRAEVKAHPDGAQPQARPDEAQSALLQAKKAAEEAHKKAEARIQTLEHENADLKDRLQGATTDLSKQADRLAQAEQEMLRLRQELEAAKKQVAELSSKYAEALIAVAIDVTTKPEQVVETGNQDAGTAVIATQPAKVKAVHAGGKKKSHKPNRNNRSQNKGSSSTPPSSSSPGD